MKHDEELATDDSAKNPLVQGASPNSGSGSSRTVWDRSGEPPSAADLEIPDFEVVRKGYSQEQVKEFVSHLALRVRNLERQIEEQRNAAARIRMIEQEFGNPGVLLERLDSLQGELAGAQAELDEVKTAAEDASAGGQERDDHVVRVENELHETRGELSRLQTQLAQARSELDASRRAQGGADPYGAIASQVAELLRSAGMQADQIRREAHEEAERRLEESRHEADSLKREAQDASEAMHRDARASSEKIAGERDEIMRQARAEAEGIKREAESYAEQLRRDAQQENERLAAERDEYLREASSEGDRLLAAAETDAKRQRAEAERALMKARTDAERMLTAAVSRRDLVRAEMLTMRERMLGAITLMEPVAEPGAEPVAAGAPEAATEEEASSVDAATEEAELDESEPYEEEGEQGELSTGQASEVEPEHTET